MKLSILHTLVPLGLLAAVSSSLAAPEQVGDFRIDANPFADRFSYFDLGFTETTRGVGGAPVQLFSTFSGTTQNPGVVGDPATDLGIRTYSSSTHLKNINRYTSDADGPGPGGGPQNVGVFQYSIDLTPVEDYLSGSGESLSALDLRFVIDPTDDSKEYDIYLSYTEVSEGITLTPVSTNDPAANYSDFWFPSQSELAGNVVNGSHKIVNLKTTGDIDQTESLLSLYSAGVRELNVIVVSGGFFSGRVLKVNEFSGVWINTDVLAADTQVGDFRLDSFGGSFTHVDRLEPTETTAVVGAPFQVPSLLSGTSQNQGLNLDVENGLAYYDIDGVDGSNGCTADGSNATVVGYGVDGIGTTAADGFQFTAWREDGDFDVNVSLDSITTSVASGARAGLMVRSSDSADAAHVFIGVQQDGAPLVVVRDTDGGIATETVEAIGTFPKTLRIKRSGDLFEFWFSKNTATPAADPDATVVMSNPVLVGFASTSGDDTDAATAVFSDASVRLPDPGTDIGLRTYSSATTIRTLNRFGGQISVGAVQWAIDLSPLDDYLVNNSLNLDALTLDLLADASDEGKEFDVYLSYTNPAESISLVGIEPQLAISADIGELNYTNLFEPANGANLGDIVNGTHKILLEYTPGDISLSEDLLSLYNAGVRDMNLIITTDAFYSGRTLGIGAGSGLFIETSGGPSSVVITDVTRVGNDLSVTVDGLTIGSSYHLGGSADLSGFPSIAGTTLLSATGTGDILTVTVADAAFFVCVLEGAAP